MVDGTWRTDLEGIVTEGGEFQRDESTFRDWILNREDARFQPEAGRYHLYVSRACPWAHRVVLVRKLKGLEDVISMDVVDPVREDQGWEFSPEKPGCTADSVLGSEYLREVYATAESDYTGRVTVPVLWDRERETIVNNESSELIRMVDTTFEEFATRDVSLFPAEHREEIEDVLSAIYGPINDGVYRAGFAKTQSAYEEAVGELFEALDRWDAALADRRYLVGDQLTLADVAMFTTLFRFDPVYHVHFKCNERKIAEYPHLSGYLRDIYQLPGVAETCNLEHVKQHYFRSHTDINPNGIVPTGPRQDLSSPHGREHLPGDPPRALQAAD